MFVMSCCGVSRGSAGVELPARKWRGAGGASSGGVRSEVGLGGSSPEGGVALLHMGGGG